MLRPAGRSRSIPSATRKDTTVIGEVTYYRIVNAGDSDADPSGVARCTVADGGETWETYARGTAGFEPGCLTARRNLREIGKENADAVISQMKHAGSGPGPL